MRLENSPLFPHYLFLLLSDNDNWSAIRSTRGVSRLVSFNGLPASLPHAIIEQLQIHCEKLHGGTPAPIYQVGQRVLITDGCFKELEAIVTANNGDERVVLLLNLFSRQQEVELSVSAVEACA
jgi:transcriptional antiterminator RfaH